MATKKKAAKKAAAKKPAAKKSAAKKKVVARKAPARKAAKKVARKKRAPNPAFMKAMTPSASLGAVVGNSALPRTEVVKKIWAYIKRNKLQDAANRRMINADDKLRPIFNKAQVSMFEMTKILNKQLRTC